jgi:hypothetical protein
VLLGVEARMFCMLKQCFATEQHPEACIGLLTCFRCSYPGPGEDYHDEFETNLDGLFGVVQMRAAVVLCKDWTSAA